MALRFLQQIARRCLMRACCRCLCLGMLWAAVLPGRSQGAGFTYQGRLVDGGLLANGNYELRFRLFNQLTAGAQFGGNVAMASVPVTNGLFTVQLDFGAGVFDGSARWLEIAARPVGSVDPLGVFDPRQPVTAVPYALYAYAGTGGGGGGNDASALTTGILPDARLSANIPRISDLLSLSNALSGALVSSNAALQAQINALSTKIDQLNASVLSISSHLQVPLLAGITVASMDPADSFFLGEGLVRILEFDAPGWTSGATAMAPTARSLHSAVWTGTSVLVWGGATGPGQVSASGASYNPALNQWSAISTLDPPSARRSHSAVWTGQLMLIWGGFGAGFLGDGASYDPVAVMWSPLGTQNVPGAREGHVTIWSGARMAVWGGRNSGGMLGDGALYDPVARTWSALPSPGAPEARFDATAVWTGTQLIVWGGQDGISELDTGGYLTLASGITPGAWTSTTGVSAPGSRTGHSAVWTGQRMIVWGGVQGGTLLGDGASFNPAGNSWEAISSTGAPTPRTGHIAVWNGEEMLVFGGETAAGTTATGGAYNPLTDSWRPLSSAGPPLARSSATGNWDGSELLVFGGISSGSPLAALQRLNPQPTWYLYRKP